MGEKSVIERYLNRTPDRKRLLKSVYEMKIGGPMETGALLALGTGALSLAPPIVQYTGILPAAILSGLGATVIGRQFTRLLNKDFLLNSRATVESSKPPIAPGSDAPGLLIGYTSDKGLPVMIPDPNLFRHMWIMGQSGMGKTVAGSQMMFQQIQRGGGVLFVDGKLDIDNIESLYQFAKWAGRGHEFWVINPGQAEFSNTYNPILYGDPDEVAARILSMIPSTEGSAGSDFYKQSSNEALVIFLSALKRARLAYNFSDLAVLMTNALSMEELVQKVEAAAPDCAELRNLNLFLDRYRVPLNDTRNPLAGQINMTKMKDVLGGLAGRMFTFGNGSFGTVLNDYDPEVKIYDAIRGNQIIYVALPTLGKDVAANNFGKILMGDVRTSLSWLQRNKQDRPTIPSMMFLDEAASYVTESWAVVFEQARSAGVFLLPAIQTDSGFSAVSDDFAERVIGNTTTKMYFRVGTTQAAEKASELIGKTRRVARTQTTNTSSSTSSQYVQISPQRMGGHGVSGGISEREEEVPLVEPDVLTSLAIGEAILQYEGNKIYDIVVPIVGLSKECRAKLGPLHLNHKRKVKTPGLNLVGRWQDFVSTPVKTRVGKRKDKDKNVDEFGYENTP